MALVQKQEQEQKQIELLEQLGDKLIGENKLERRVDQLIDKDIYKLIKANTFEINKMKKVIRKLDENLELANMWRLIVEDIIADLPKITVWNAGGIINDIVADIQECSSKNKNDPVKIGECVKNKQ